MIDTPATIPSMCGIDLRKPKLAPAAISIRLFGPGVTVATKAKPKRAISMEMVMELAFGFYSRNIKR